LAISVKIDDELKNRVQHLAETRQRSAHWIMREAITHYVAREEAKGLGSQNWAVGLVMGFALLSPSYGSGDFGGGTFWPDSCHARCKGTSKRHNVWSVE
jgi:hypothetical protein